MAGRMAEMRCRKGRDAPGGEMQQSPCCSAPVPVHARTGRIGKGNRRICEWQTVLLWKAINSRQTGLSADLRAAEVSGKHRVGGMNCTPMLDTTNN